jgi:cytochrome c553
MRAAFVSFAFLLACGGKSSPATTTTTPAPAEPAAHAVLPDVAFDQLDQDQRAEFMKQHVITPMKAAFQQHDATKFAKFTCETCHGKGAAEGHFDMPNPELPKLVVKELMSGTSKYKKADVEWMGKEIKPAMAKILKLPEWTPETPKGFGCNGCHVMEE